MVTKIKDDEGFCNTECVDGSFMNNCPYNYLIYCEDTMPSFEEYKKISTHVVLEAKAVVTAYLNKKTHFGEKLKATLTLILAIFVLCLPGATIISLLIIAFILYTRWF